MMSVVIGLSAVIVAIRDGEAVVLVVRPRPSEPAGLPFGPFDPGGHRTFELAMRAFVTEQTQFELGYVEQLYTFGDLDRDRIGASRHLAIAYLALVREAVPTPGSHWVDIYDLLPWEDHRASGPDTEVQARIGAWAGDHPDRLRRVRLAFGTDVWDGYRSLDRYELLYEAGLVAEHHLDRGLVPPADVIASRSLGGDHRRIAATALGRLRGKLTYRPVVFELLPESFTLRTLQRVVECLAGEELHTQNFRRLVETARLVEPTGERDVATGGRPASLHKFRAEVLLERPRPGVTRPPT